jgi:hypothetical protein
MGPMSVVLGIAYVFSTFVLVAPSQAMRYFEIIANSSSSTSGSESLSGYSYEAVSDLVEDLPGWGKPTSRLFSG